MAPKFTQDNRPMAILAPSLGKDVLLLRGFAGEEGISRPFRYELDLVSEKPDVDFTSIVGKNVTIQMKMANGTPTYLDGVISRFSQGGKQSGDTGLTAYSAEMVPYFWLFSQNRDCRNTFKVFQKKTVKQIIEGFLALVEHTNHSASDVKETYPTLEYCVQYRESDFNFLSRLMEQYGIFYYFKHDKGSHQLVIGDSNTAFGTCSGHAEVKYQRSDSDRSEEDMVTAWLHEHRVRPSAAALADYNFETPVKLGATPPTNKLLVPEGTQSGPIKSEVYDYPGKYLKVTEGKPLVKSRLQAEEVDLVVVTGSSNCRGFRSGYRFKLKNHYRDDFSKPDVEYLITSMTSWATEAAYESGGEGEFNYGNEFEAIPIAPASRPFRPPRVTPRPKIAGTQTALVVGPPDAPKEEIHCDKYGRIKVQFHWDRTGKQDWESSCYVRVASPWAGKHWGVQFIPRIGQEVVVAFLEGDPDRPLVVGSVYNADQMPPYELPANQTRSTIKSNSSMGGEGFNEIRFEDKKGKEQIFVHAEHNMDVRVKASSMESVGGSRHLTVGGEKDGSKSGDQKEMVYRDKHLKVHRNQEELIGGDMLLHVGGVDGGEGNVDIDIGGKKRELIEKDSELQVAGNRIQEVIGDQSLTVHGNQQEKVGQKHAVDAGMEIHLKAGMKVVIEGGTQVTMKVGGNFVDINPAGVTITGTLVMINSGGAAGSGGGSSPTAFGAVSVAEPAAPAGADNATSGQKSCG
jgi:type VI secretion system secreted protein VgrG